MSRTLKTVFVFLAVTLFVVFMISGAGMNLGSFNAAQVAGASEPGIAEGRKSQENELQELLMERRRILSRIVESMKIFLESGRISIDEYRDANIALLRAEMDLCKTRDNRLEILEKIVQFHRTHEAQMAKRAADRRATEIDVERAKVARLEAQIELIWEKLKRPMSQE